MKVLLADDDLGIQKVVSRIVSGEGYECFCAGDGVCALGQFFEKAPDLVILDVSMPEMDGYEVCARIREVDKDVPIIFLTARGDIVDKSVAFKAGADDYLVKPFIPQELKLRIQALLRRRHSPAREDEKVVLRFSGLEIDARRRKVLVRGANVDLTPKEFHLLYLLALHPGEVFTKDQLVKEIWGPEYRSKATGITVLIHRLREKIEENPSTPVWVQTVWHVGYRFGD